ncbi:tRNA (adenosine(37)-N6)-dimethylallyltransferase MiaA [Paludibacterium purpuratum]|uniref:tRNA dimethylallyltransferase n=1 Tax=Paludibacterium purpuratum TaxID=1144873 RepID=A0A4R7B8V7_9NEIS|nr:tRNA (adenosine(37)-N6)-dimethylallyltransferase MiaA [Paludibacterium purpuratum]TDR80027.1 tRNA dimethylallyltransferase [Paludibacterium purpuratum]
MKHDVLFLMGPTASGKTALTFELARHFPIEIVSVDSALVYRDMDIGTAKPSREEQALCPHHLIDIISPLESYSAAQFCADAERLIDEIHARGHIPLLAGGTMLYYKALLEGLSELPQADAALRAQLDRDAAAHGWPALHARLAELDPVSAARLKPNDAQRIQRALEVCLLAGRPMSELFQDSTRPERRWRSLNLALVPAERRWLHERIALRFRQMLAAGFLDEVSALRSQYPELAPAMPSMRCVGYRQAWEYQDGACSYDEMVERGIAATRQLCKRQLTWMRSLDVLPLDAQQDDVALRAVALCTAFLAGDELPANLLYSGGY